jgi:CBS domain-containing protein
MKVKQAMHKGVQWVEPGTSVFYFARLMREHDIGAIPMGENDRLIGMAARVACWRPASTSRRMRKP